MEAARATFSVTTSCGIPESKKIVWFAQMSLEDLRDLAKWPDGSRAQILAWCHNRYRCGYMYVIEHGNPSSASFL